MDKDYIKLTFPDGTVKKFKKGTIALDIAKKISKELGRNVLAVELDGKIYDATKILNKDAKIRFLTWDDEGGKKTFWHSSAHLMAEALETLYPGVKFGIGPPVENGFYYDVDLEDKQLSEHDLKKIEEKMKELAKNKSKYIREEVPKSKAIEYFKKKNDEYKLELINELNDGEITFYRQGNFVDLCKGPHIPDTGKIKAIKLTKIAGAYWRGNEKNKMLTRIYGITFPKQKLLDEYLNMIEEAKKRDHRKLGRDLELFIFSENVGSGLPLWLPRGNIIREQLIKFLQSHQKEMGYKQVVTPHIGNKKLYEISGHYEKYREDSFKPIKTPNEGEEFLLKPMNCPHHCEIYKSKQYSYKDLPVRIAEFGTVYRYEQSGELHGLTRVRSFTQDDAHIFCTPEQLDNEFKKVIDLVLKVFTAVGFEKFEVQISLKSKDDNKKYIGSEENWQKAENAIIKAVNDKGLKAKIEYGEAAFYGPKLDFMVKDALNRKWQLGTIQVDYNLPERFGLEYTGKNNEKLQPVMIHRAPFGSLERFIAILLEHTSGNLPLWLAPDQFVILPISEKFNKNCEKLFKILKKYEIRGFIDYRNEKISKKIRDAEVKKIPYMLILGEKEVKNNTVSVRKHKKGDLGTFKIEEILKKLKNEIILAKQNI